ncbi:MAG: hypothetical protein R3E45_06720 [Rhodocyclaceae bacterium]
MYAVICRILPHLFLAVVSLAAALPATAAGIVPGVVCDGCHGTGGHSAGTTIPSLAGQDRDYFVIAMQAFRSGERPSTVMGPLARGLTDKPTSAAWPSLRPPDTIGADRADRPRRSRPG